MCSCLSQRAAYTVLADRMAALERGWGNGDIIDVLQFVFWLVSVAFFLCGQYQQRQAVDRRFANVAADQEHCHPVGRCAATAHASLSRHPF